MAVAAAAIIALGGFLTPWLYRFVRRTLIRKGYKRPRLFAALFLFIAVNTAAGWVLIALQREMDPPISGIRLVPVVISFFALIVLYFVAAVKSGGLLRNTLVRKGHKSPAVRVSTYFLAGACILTGWLILGRHRDMEPLPYAAALVIVIPLLGSLVVWLLPGKNPRTGGPRVVRFPYTKVGYAILCLTPTAPLAAWLTRKPQIGLQGTLMLVSLGATALSIGRRAHAPLASTVLAVDPRPPALYLRAFSGEEATFAELPWRGADIGHNLISHLMQRPQRRFQTLEAYLGAEIGRAIGPLIALGNPAEFVSPGEAARLYLPDDRWMAEFSGLAGRAALIVMTMGATEHLRWEMRHLRESGLQEKLFVLTKPQPAEKAWFPISLISRPLKRQEQIPWAEFASSLRQAGYVPSDVDPGPGAVASFDRDGRMIVLSRNVQSPAVTIQVIFRKIVPGRS